MTPDIITLDLKGSEELTKLLEGKSPGDECVLEVTVRIDELSEEMMAGSIISVASIDPADEDGYEDEDVLAVAPPL